MKYNWQFCEGPKGLKVNCNYMNEMSKCNTAQSPPTLECFTFFFHCRYFVFFLPFTMWPTRDSKSTKWSSGVHKATYGNGECIPRVYRLFLSTRLDKSYKLAEGKFQCYICSSHSYNYNLPSSPLGPRKIVNYVADPVTYCVCYILNIQIMLHISITVMYFVCKSPRVSGWN